MRGVQKIGFIYLLAIVIPFQLLAQGSIVEDFSSNTGWTQVGTNVEIKNGKVEYSNLATDGQQRRIHKSLGDSIGYLDTIIAEFDFHPTAVGSHPGGRYAGHLLFGLTAGTSEAFSDCPNIPCTGFPRGTQDGVMVGYTARNPSTDSLFFLIRSKDSTSEFISKRRIFSEFLDTTYYLRAEHFPCVDSFRLSVFFDSARTIPLSGSPITTYMPNNLNDFTTVQIGNVARGDPRRGLSGFIDNLNIEWNSYPQVSGIINRYTPVSIVSKGLCSDTLLVDSTIGLQKNDRVLIMQMKGASIVTSNTASFGDIISYNDAGNYEFTTVDTVISNRIILQDTLLNQYDSAGKIQLVYVPTFENVVTSGNLTAAPWDGSTGGVLALEVKDTLELKNDIVLDGLGFRGGKNFFGSYTFSSSACNQTAYSNPIGNSNGGQKGESITLRLSNIECGRGKLATGGGGGNSHNAGGGGGGNFGSGGLGGDEWVGCGSNSVGGVGGDSIAYPSLVNKAFLGGGGGGGEANGLVGTDGGNGGGIAFIKASTFKGNHHTISSKGIGALTAAADGAGGGGAGGSILLDIATYIDTLQINVDGGKGGDNNNPGSCVGTGGGGGGGLIWHNSTNLPTNVLISTQGGAAGLFTNSNQATCFNTNYGALAGTDGGLMDSLSISYPTSIPEVFDLGADTTLCFGDSMSIIASFSNASFKWQDNSSDSIFIASKEGKYWVDVSIANNCKVFSDTIIIDIDSSAYFNFGNDTSLCIGDSLELSVEKTTASFLWNNGTTDSFLVAKQSEQYWVEVTKNTCVHRDSINVGFSNPVPFSLGKDSSLCLGDSIILQIARPNASYLWNNNSTDSVLVVKQTGLYWLEVIENGCSFRDSINLDFSNSIPFSLGNDTSICPSDSLIIESPITNNVSYLWNDSSTDSVITAKTRGIYWLELTKNSCSFRDSIVLSVDTIILDLGPDRTICNNETIVLDASNPNSTYMWQDNSTSPTYSVTTAGVYIISVNNSCEIQRDTVQIDEENCDCIAEIPNVFTPNADGINDSFFPKLECLFSDYSLLIFNRWNEKIFESNSPMQIWDGTYKGKGVSKGVYSYVLSYKTSSGALEVMTGNVTLLR